MRLASLAKKSTPAASVDVAIERAIQPTTDGRAIAAPWRLLFSASEASRDSRTA
jgi:hypothetical protein